MVFKAGKCGKKVERIRLFCLSVGIQKMTNYCLHCNKKFPEYDRIPLFCNSDCSYNYYLSRPVTKLNKPASSNAKNKINDKQIDLFSNCDA